MNAFFGIALLSMCGVGVFIIAVIYDMEKR